MLLIAATSYNQTSRKSANTNRAATGEKPNTSQTNTSTVSRSSSENRSVTTDRNEQRSPVTRSENTSTPRTRNNNNQSTQRNTEPTTRNTNVNRSENNNTSRSNNYSSGNTNIIRTPRSTGTVTYTSPRVYRENHVVNHYYTSPPRSREYRAVHYAYRRPVHIEVYWTPYLHRHFLRIYPMVPYWSYYNGYRIEMISAYDALYYQGEVMTVYGRVNEVYYSRVTDEYFLYFGPYYPYQDFTLVMPGYLARRYSRHPEIYFTDQYLAVTGLITTFNGEPEIVVKEKFQINLY